MQKETITVNLPEGRFITEIIKIDETDRPLLIEIYNLWRELSTKLIHIGGRGINLPEGLSENLFCLEMKVVRTANLSSFDCYRLEDSKRIQVKACSVLPDLTSFGPNSVWDELYFMDFYRQGFWDGTFDIYLISNDDIYNQKVNRTQTVRDQQLLGRRPRFSIYKDIIQSKNLQPVKTGNVFSTTS